MTDIIEIPISQIKNRALRRTVLVVGTPLIFIACVPLFRIGAVLYWKRVIIGMIVSFAKVWRM